MNLHPLPFVAVLALAAFALPAARAASAAQPPTGKAPAIQPALPSIPDRTFDLRQFGAKGDGVADETAAIKAAIHAARSAGGGTVEISPGVYLSGPFELASRVDLRVAAGATLRMLPLDRYPGGTAHPENFIGGSDLHDVAITGGGTIDGQGQPWWPFAKVKGASRPRMIALASCERILIAQVTLMNSPMFHIAISGRTTRDVTVRGVTIRAPASTDPVAPSHNTDACDVSGRNILIQDCDVSVGDDNFTCGGGTSNVLITHCTYGNGHGVSIGSYTNGGVANFTVTDCAFTDTECGIRIKSDRDRGGLVHNLRYENLRMTNVGCPILIYGAYKAEEREFRDLNHLTPAVAARYPSEHLGARTPVYRDIVFRNIIATAQPGRRAGLIWGLPEAPVANVLLEHVAIKADLPFGVFDVQGIRLVGTAIVAPEGVNRLSTSSAQVEIVP